MLAATTSITGASVICALLVVLVAFVLEKVAPDVAWVALATLFVATLVLFTLTVRF